MNTPVSTEPATLKRSALRRAMAAPSPVVAVGAHDALTAKLIERYEFDAVWVSGFGVATMGHATPASTL